MIIIEFLSRIFIDIIFEGIILGFFKLLGKGIKRINNWIFGINEPFEPLKVLKKKYLYKEFEIIEDLNSKLKHGRKGLVLEIIDENKIFAEVYDSNGNPIEWNDENVFEIELRHIRLKK